MDVFDAPIRPQIVAASRQIPNLVATPGSKKKRPGGRVRRAPFCQRGWLIEQGSFLCCTPSFAFLVQVTPAIGLIGLRLDRFCEQEVR
jgi:hypothetical protein